MDRLHLYEWSLILNIHLNPIHNSYMPYMVQNLLKFDTFTKKNTSHVEINDGIR